MKPLISIIVPVYGAERYLRRCVDSILAQTYSNIEVILVDDGSQDQCPQICDVYAKQDARVRVIHKQNGGLSDARNCGIAAARGELIGFVDSDDAIMPDMYAYLYDGMSRTDSDIAVCGVSDEYEDVQPGLPSDMNYIIEETVLNRGQAVEAVLRDEVIVSHAWDKLYKKECFNEIKFPIKRRFEDLPIMPLVFNCARQVVLLPDKKYIYTHHSCSISYTKAMLNAYHIFLAFAERFAFSKEHYSHLGDEMLNKAVVSGVNFYNAYLKQPAANEDIHLKDAAIFLAQNLKWILAAKCIGLKYKCFAYSIVRVPRLHKMLYTTLAKLFHRS